MTGWMARCCESVRAWATQHGWEYRFVGDELFDRLPPVLRARLVAQQVVASDLARLLWLREVLDEGHARAIWCDADLLLFSDFSPPAADHAFGREVWVQASGRGLRSYRKIHNAYLLFSAQSVVLPYYLDRARHLLERVELPVVPQFVGPKLLTAWHNIVPFAVEERVGMLSPLALRDLNRGGGPALARTLAGHAGRPCAFNLCASAMTASDATRPLQESELAAAVQRLLGNGLPD
jgi:hypothetical protein